MLSLMQLGIISVLGWLAFKVLSIGKREANLPPGPPTIPVLGNIHLLPRKFMFVKFSEWAKEYGGIFSLKIANSTMIVLSDMRAVKEILDDHSIETSSRPFFYALEAVTNGKFFLLASSDNESWKVGRKLTQLFMTSQAAHSHARIAEQESIQLLHDILESPLDICQHFTRYTFSAITSLTFGRREPNHDSPKIREFADYIRNFTNTISPEAAPVDLIPILKYIPERFAPWKRLWKVTQAQQQALYYSLLEYTESKVRGGNGSGSFVETLLEKQAELKLSRDMIAYIAGVLMDGGTESTATTLQSLILCLVKSPASYRKAQEEIDRVVGNGRLPVASDINNLPYIQAILKEIQRLRPAGPTGIPHAATKNLQYGEYIIPKGVPIMINVWGILNDPDLYERPDEFWPERYMIAPDGTKPDIEKEYSIRASLPFGSGKRLCPGIHFANMNLNMATMRFIWAFNLTAFDEQATSTDIWDFQEEYLGGVTFTPKPFQCKITPRSEERKQMIMASYEASLN
ncbi:Cytochrome P450 monooxygenase [Psilocybe cubensis]|uniref:Cytochrome P450 monooxygenase n=1 Tax=Psilocybe cubensis TaxID=181762 RepID=A0ACB8GMI7_PSICU|nr:Cytochrome P450 monooxygenase [Psilocybe cubensis]KAH9476426.1 Cytochrome P450 monooxygenase [Psilocybe cubensis]